MKRFMFAAIVAAAVAPAFAATDVGVSINVGQPGFYGQINIGDVPPPQLIYQQPVIIQRPVRIVRQPIYLHVPPGHEKNWGKHCRKYNACGQQVYFVQNDWYNDVYVPRHRERHEDRGERHGRGNGHDDRDDDRGERHGGKGKDKGHDKHRNKD